MQRILIMSTFLQDHFKPVLLWVGSVGIWTANTVTELANGALNSAEKIGSLSVTTLLALICIVLGIGLWKKETELKEERLAQEKKAEAREARMTQLVDRNSNAIESNTDAMEDLRAEMAKQTQYLEGGIKSLIEKGLDAPAPPRPRNGITNRSKP